MVLAVDYLQAMRVRAKMKRTLDELYSKFDTLVAPSHETVSYPIGQECAQVYRDSAAALR